MSAAFDDRLVTLDIELNGQKVTYNQDYYIIATGRRFTNGNFGECTIRIDNISKSTRDYLAAKTTPWIAQRQTAIVTLSVGRQSYGTFQLFNGNAIASNPTQPPDIGLIIRSLSQSGGLGYASSITAPAFATLQSVCQLIAQSQNPPLTLDFQAKNNPQISNYHFTGSVAKQIQKLNDLGLAYAYVDNTTLVVTDLQTPRQVPTIALNAQTGLIGVPEVTEIGARARMLINNEVKIGAPVTLTSVVNPAVNGDYYITTLSYEVASRDTPFYWIMDLTAKNLYLGAPT